MNLKLLRSTLCLLSVSALFTDGASAQPGSPSYATDIRAELARDYNQGRYKDVIADGELLRKAGALDTQIQLVIAQAYYKAGDLAGCVRYAKTVNRHAILTPVEG